MDERWKRIDQIFSEALDLPVPERAAYVRKVARSDETRIEVEHLLELAEAAETDPDTNQIEPQLIEELFPDPNIGREIGSYRVVRPIGRGGMGAVYLAERTRDYEQLVAIKILPLNVLSEEDRARFLQERQIVARLEHAHIARLLDGGECPPDDDGRLGGEPYLVLEYVAGPPITEHVQGEDGSAPLSLKERLGFFLQVTAAVQYAHSHLVVHRDLKPSNVLVSPRGGVKLLDFGIARLLGVGDPQLTTTGRRALTPAYASPEQLSGAPVSTASDVYQLGTLLYELLTGRGPFDRALPRRELEAAIHDVTPPRPSEVTGPGGVPSGLLRGDLDAIVLMALRKEPERRFGSVDALARDIRAALAGEPVSARPDSFGYRAARLVNRHRWIVPAVAASLVALTGYAVTLVRHNSQLEQEQATSEAVTDFLTGVFTISDPEQGTGTDVTARDLLDRGAEEVDEQLADQPEVRARMLEVLGSVYTQLELPAEGVPLLERALSETETLYGQDSESTARARAAYATALHNAGRFDDAEAEFASALAVRLEELGDDHPLTVRTRYQLATAVHRGGDFERADSLYDEWFARFQGLGTTDTDPRTFEELGTLTQLRQFGGDWTGAEELSREVLTRAREIYPPEHPVVFEATRNLGTAAFYVRKLDEARGLWGEALRVADSVYGADSGEMANVRSMLARTLTAMDSVEGAAVQLEESVRIKRALDSHWRQTLFADLSTLGNAYRRLGRDADAARVLEEAVVEVDANVGSTTSMAGITRASLARVQASLGDTATAEGLFREGLAAMDGKSSAGRQAYLARRDLGRLLRDQGRLDEAEPVLLAAYEGAEALQAADSLEVRADVAEELVELYVRWERDGEAEEWRGRLAPDAAPPPNP